MVELFAEQLKKRKEGKECRWRALVSSLSLFVEHQLTNQHQHQLNLTRKSQTLEFRIDDSGDASSDCGDLELLTSAADTL